MASYLINKNHHDESVVTIQELDGYTFKPRTNRKDLIQVKNVTVVDRVMLDKIISMKFDKAFKRLVALAIRVIEDEDATDDECQIALDEAELVRQIFFTRYQKYLKKEKEELLLKKLRLIENELRTKQVKIKQKAIYLEMEEEKMRGRGR